MRPVFGVARLTAIDILRQPATWLVAGLGLVLVGLSLAFGMFNFDSEDRLRMMCTAGVAVQVICCLFVAVVGATSAVHDELASRTAHTLFAKPLSRADFLVGKAMGVMAGVAAVAAVIIAGHLLAVAMGAKTGFEFGRPDDGHGHGGWELTPAWGALLMAHLLGFLQAACLTCLALVLALRLGLAANIILCAAAFVAANLLPAAGLHGAVVLPALDLLNLDEAFMQPEAPLAWARIGGAALHAGLWCVGGLLVGLALLESQDIP
jgi:hypothetical protein